MDGFKLSFSFHHLSQELQLLVECWNNIYTGTHIFGILLFWNFVKQIHTKQQYNNIGNSCQSLFNSRYQGQVGAALVLGGVDVTGPCLYTIAPHGSTDKLPFVTMGMRINFLVIILIS